MGHESTVYGVIIGATYKSTDYRRLQRLNRQVIDALPETDDWPFLTRGMFSINGERPEDGTYRCHTIHFAATFKSIEWEWEEWLTKFENLLSKLFWFEAS